MIDCIIGYWNAILRISAHGQWDKGVISRHSIRDIEICLMPTLFCIVDIVTFFFFYFS